MAKKPKAIPITRPTLEPFSRYAPLFKKTLTSGMLTMGPHVAELEKKAASYLGVKHCIAVSSCTAGLMLVFKGLGLKGEVIMPSFTFLASGLPLLWGDVTPVFADIDPKTYCLDPQAAEKLITKKTAAIFATHVFGVPCNVGALQKLAHKHKLKLIFDAAHAFGSTSAGTPVGRFGDAEVFSCSPTKVLTTGEGGIVATNDTRLATFVRQGRNYGDTGNNDISIGGLSARMPELSAAVGLRSLAALQTNLRRRRGAARYLRARLQKIEPRLRFQHISAKDQTTFKDFSIYIDPALGYTRDDLHVFFARRDIATRKYFYPSLHRMRAYRHGRKGSLAVTDQVAGRVLSLPMYAHLSRADCDRIVLMFKRFIYDRKKS